MTLINILIMDDGSIKMAVPDGSFEEGSHALSSLILDLNAGQIRMDLDGPIEQHRHSVEQEHVHLSTQTHTH